LSASKETTTRKTAPMAKGWILKPYSHPQAVVATAVDKEVVVRVQKSLSLQEVD
jgi:hypothetical protein